MSTYSAFGIYAALNLVVIVFQLCLALGVPWGSASMGGRYPGAYPKNKRIIPIVSIGILLLLTFLVAADAGLLLSRFNGVWGILIWLVAGYYGLATLLNTITQSKIERIWAPVAGVQLVCVLLIALA